jgi:exonuclease III
MATWNIRTILAPGKMEDIAEETVTKNIDILALQEVRWNGIWKIAKGNYTFYYSGTHERTGQYGTGFMVAKQMKDRVLQFDPISERISKLRIKGKFRNISIITIHAPTEEKEIETKGEFYEKLEEVYDRIPKYDTIIIMGDVNAKVGTKDVDTKVTGKYSLHTESNENGNLLFTVCNKK